MIQSEERKELLLLVGIRQQDGGFSNRVKGACGDGGRRAGRHGDPEPGKNASRHVCGERKSRRNPYHAVGVSSGRHCLR